ncbi:MAG: 1-deoxy-D-xylulose-5-phosphate reductoisomerase [Christensenellales bacterium]|jgi:1-deoxy-D-xylulose-5-phosphate reductoisomerase
MNRLAILGATGSIGSQTLDLVRRYPDRLSVTALAAGRNVQGLLRAAQEFAPRVVSLEDEAAARALAAQLPAGIQTLSGHAALEAICAREDVDTVVVAVVGIAGLDAVLSAIANGKRVALANKEALVAGGELVNQALARFGGKLYPVDSEHSAIFQCLQGQPAPNRILLTASGGPFRGYSAQQMRAVTREQALKHPNWSMGAKITIDSATMMNKGLEVIEAHHLFGLDAAQISVVVHPQSIVHSAVEFADRSVIAQMGHPDMRLPILYALSHPDRWEAGAVIKPLTLFDVGAMTFEEPDLNAFPCLKLAFDALAAGQLATVCLNGANEQAVELFLRDQIAFWEIPCRVEEALGRVDLTGAVTLERIYQVDAQARAVVCREGEAGKTTA